MSRIAGVIRRLLCEHRWKAVGMRNIEHVGSGHSLATGAIIGFKVNYRCAHCGATKTSTHYD